MIDSSDGGGARRSASQTGRCRTHTMNDRSARARGTASAKGLDFQPSIQSTSSAAAQIGAFQRMRLSAAPGDLLEIEMYMSYPPL